MKFIVVLYSLIAFCQSSPVTLYREVSPGQWIPEIITSPLRDYTVDDDDIKIYFRTQNNSANTIPINLTNLSELTNEGYSNEKDTFFIIHGWQNQYNSSICEEVSDAVLQVKDANVFLVDWSKFAKNLYIVAKSSVPDVGKIVSKLITDLIEQNGLDLNKTIIVGHSLGAHIAGMCGQVLNGQVNHIVGLDPALPLFELNDEHGRLDASDANFVQVIHTCAGLLGFNRDLGDVDYWPNGGSNQPGCGGIFDIGGTCSHSRSYYLFAESIISGGFLSRKCDSYNNYKKGKCDSESTSMMGEYEPDKNATGDYYLKTNSESPFAQN